MSTIKQPEMWQ